MKQFSIKAPIIISKLYGLKLCLSFCQKEANFICQLLHISSENVCQSLLALFMQLHKHNIHLVLIYLLHTAQAEKLLLGNCLISQYFSQGNCLCGIHQFYGLLSLILESRSMLSIQSHTEQTHYRTVDEQFTRQKVKLALLES